MVADSDSSPRLLSRDGQRYVLARGRSTIGRNPDADVWVNDQTVGRQHAELCFGPDGVTITDLRSINGTWLNDRRIAEDAPCRLRHNDIVRVGGIDLRYAAPSGGHDAVADTVGIAGTPSSGRSFSMGWQQADQLNNVAGDQYLQSIYAQRESFLREVAASRTRAKRLIWLGFLLFIGGFGLFASMIIRFMSRSDEFGLGNEPSISDFLGEKVGGVPLGLIGWAGAGLGALMMIVGIVLHIVATSRQRRTVNQPIVVPGAWR